MINFLPASSEKKVQSRALLYTVSMLAVCSWVFLVPYRTVPYRTVPYRTLLYRTMYCTARSVQKCTVVVISYLKPRFKHDDTTASI
jgi:hypothetical protein